jgi:hypothetical protein
LSKPCERVGTGTLSEQEVNDIIDKHFLCHAIIKTYYPQRKSNPGALEKVIGACRDQIALAPLAARAFRKKWKGDVLPGHYGYEQLAIILEKLGKYAEAVALCEEASKTEWRGGGWEQRLTRLRKKLENKSG